jgi:hypothetical protein
MRLLLNLDIKLYFTKRNNEMDIGTGICNGTGDFIRRLWREGMDGNCTSRHLFHLQSKSNYYHARFEL